MNKEAPEASTRVLARRRSKALVLGIATGLGSRVLTLAAPLLTIPVTLHYLGSELFGFWMVISSITAMAMFADLGLGNGLLTALSPTVASGNRAEARSLISTAYATLGLLSVVLVAVIWVVSTVVDWAPLFDAETEHSVDTFRAVVGLCLSGFAITIPLSLVQRVQYAYQEAWKSNLWQVAGAATTVAVVYLAVGLDLGPVAAIGAAVLAGPFVLLLNNVTYFGWSRRYLIPTWRRLSAPTAKALLGIGASFFILSILTSIALNIDNVIVANVAGLETVGAFSVTTKLFSLLGLAITLVALPLWPANGEALARGDLAWVRRTTTVMAILSVAAVAVGGIVLVLARDLIAAAWLGVGTSIPFDLAASLVLWSILLAFASPFFSVQNSIGLLKFQYIGWAIFLVVSVPAKLLLYGQLGLAGIPLASSCLYALVLIPSALIGYRRTLQRSGHRTAVHAERVANDW